MRQESKPRFTLDHVGLVVSDLDEAVNFYVRAFEMQVALIEDDTYVDSVAIGIPDRPVRLRGATLSGGGANIELHQYLTPSGAATREVFETGFGHIAFDVSDIEAAYEQLKDLGVQFNTLPQLIEHGTLTGRRWVYGKDPWGNVIELGQNPEEEKESREYA